MQHQDTTTRRKRLVVLVLFANNVLLAILSHIQAIHFGLFGKTTGNDYASFYIGWSMIRNRLWEQLYTIEGQVDTQLQIFGNLAPPYVHPPHSAAPFLWLAGLPFDISNTTWLVLNYMFFAILLWQLWREWVHTWQPAQKWGFFIIALAFPAVSVNILIGNMAILMCLIVLNLFLQMRRGNVWWVGVLLFLGSIKYQLFIILGLYLLGARWWRSILIGAGLMIIAWVATSLVMGWSIWTRYAAFVQEFSLFWSEHGINPQDGYNFRAFLALILGREFRSIINLVSLVVLAICGMVAFVLGRQAVPRHSEWSIAFVLILALYTSPHLYLHDLVILSIVGVAFYTYLRHIGFHSFALDLVLLCLPWLLYVAIFFDPKEGHPLGWIKSLLLLPLIWYIWNHRPQRVQLPASTP